MKALSSLGIGLSIVFCLLFFALMVEVYYLLWWKKRVIASSDIDDDRSSSAKEFLDFFCCKKPSSLSSRAFNPEEVCTSARIADSDGTLIKPLGAEDGMETELMRLHNLQGPPRILFTIKEETKEDLESEDRSRKGSRRRSFSDVVSAANANATDTPIMTPISSPPFLARPFGPTNCYSQHGFNPLFESRREDVGNWNKASPPPKFKFLRDAEEKLYRKTLTDEALKVHKSAATAASAAAKDNLLSIFPSLGPEEKNGSFIRIIFRKEQETVNQQQQEQQQNSTS